MSLATSPKCACGHGTFAHVQLTMMCLARVGLRGRLCKCLNYDEASRQEQMTNFSNCCAAVGGREVALAKKVLPALSAAQKEEDIAFSIVSTPGDRCGNSGRLENGYPCPGCRACQ